ncbi:unnamed protein product [Mortierella alpina]
MHSVNQKINDLNQKRKMFLYGTGEKSPDKEDRESSLERQRLEDIELLHQLGVTYINDLMVENRKVKYGLKVTSSEKVDSFGRYSKFKLVATPYPGVEFFQKFKANKYSARKLCFDWSQNFADAELQLPQGYLDNLGIRWRDYKSWDLIELTQNYLRLYLTHVADDTRDEDPSTAIKNAMGATARSPKGLLIHCISGWDRTPLFISLLRISLWADGEAHQSLTAAEMLYLTMGYDWFLFNHLLADRSQRGEDIFYFCFYFLKFIYGEEFSLQSISEVNKKSTAAGRPNAYQTASHSPLLKDIGRLRSTDNASISPELIDTNGFICEECRVSRKTPTESIGRDATSARNNSHDAASSTDGKPSSWQLVTFSTPPGHRQGSPRLPFLPTLQNMSKGSGSPRGNKRSSLSSGFMERLEGPDAEAATSTVERRSSATSPFNLADGRFRLGVPQVNARRSSSSNIPELFGADSKSPSATMNTGIEFIRVEPSPESLTTHPAEEHEKGVSEDGKGSSSADKPQTPRKRASTFDGGLLLSGAQESRSDAEDPDVKEQEEDLTNSDDDNDDLSGTKDHGQMPPRAATPSKADLPQTCQMCHHSFQSGSRQPNIRSGVKRLSGAFTPTGPRQSSTPDRVNTPLSTLSLSQQQPMNISAKQALERMRNVDRIFAQDDDGEPYFDGSHHGLHHHHTADPHVNESDREEGMFQLEIEDHRSPYRQGHFSMCEKRAREAHCLDKMHSSDPGCHDSLNSSICIEQDVRARSGMLAPANETESLDGENESFWEETSTVDYGCSPGSILNGFGLGLTKCHPEEEDLSMIMDGSLGSHADRSLQNEEEDDDDDDDDDGAASLNSRQSSLKMDHHENEHLFMPSLKGVFSHSHRFSHGRDGRKEGSSLESSFTNEGRRSSLSTGAGSTHISTGTAAAGSTEEDSGAGASTPVPRILTRKQKLRQLRRLFMEIRDEIGDGSQAPPQTAEGVNIMNPASSSVEDDDSGSSFNRESFSDDPSFQYRSPIAAAAAFASRHRPSTASTTSGQSLFGLGSPTRHFGATAAAVSPTARTRKTHPAPHQRPQQQQTGPGIQPSSGRKSPFEWAAAAAASISSSASGMVSGGGATRQSPALAPDSDYGYPHQHRKSSSLSQPQSSSPSRYSSDFGHPFVLPPVHHQYHHSQEQNAQRRGGYGEAGHIISPCTGASLTTPSEEVWNVTSTSGCTTTTNSVLGEMMGHHGKDSVRRQSLVSSSTTSSTSSASSRLRGGPSTSASHMKEKAGETTGRWDW